MSLKRMIPFLLINVLVSTVLFIALWSYFERRDAQREPLVDQAAQTLPTPTLAGNNEVVVATQPPAAVDAPQPTATVAAAGGPTVHVVEPGESLGAIAAQYDLGISQLVEANDLADPNQIFVGQRLVIPLDDEQAEPEVVADQPPTEVPPIEVVTGESTIEIGTVEGAGDVAAEQVQIRNVGDAPVTLANWTLADEGGNVYTFGPVTLFPGVGAVTIHTASGQDGATDLYWNLDAPVWAAGETVILRDPGGNIQAEYIVP